MKYIHQYIESYRDIVDKFGSNVIEKRFAALCDKAEAFIVEMGFTGKVQLNRFLMICVLMDYFSDIARIKNFHKISRVNAVKITAYEIQWLLRRKPLQILEYSKDVAFANEQFANTRILEYLLSTAGESCDLTQVQFFLDTLYYYLCYRQVNAQAIELALVAFEAGRIIEGGKPAE